MGKSFSRHGGRSTYNRVPCESRSLPSTASSRANETIRVNVGILDKDELRCRIIVDGESVLRLIRGRSDEDANPSSLVFDIPIKVFLSPPSRESCDPVKSAPPHWYEDQLASESVSPFKSQLPPPYPQGSKADKPTTNAEDRCNSADALDGNNLKNFAQDQLRHRFHHLSASTVEGGEPTIHLRRCSDSAPSHLVVDQNGNTPLTSNVASPLVESTNKVGVWEKLASRLRRTDNDDESASTGRLDIATVDVDRSPWERLLLPDVQVIAPTATSPTTERQVTCSSAPCCVARGRQVVEDGARTASGDSDQCPVVDFDKRQLAELLRQNMDLNVQLSRQRTRKCVTSTSPPSTRRSGDHSANDRFNETSRLCSAVVLPHTTELPNRTSQSTVEPVPSSSPTAVPGGQNPDDLVINPASSADDVLVSKRDWLRLCTGDAVDQPAATSSPKMLHPQRSSAHCRPPRRVVIGGHADADDGSPLRRRTSGTRRSQLQQPETVSTSHYYRRHRHRARNQTRAMLQVAEWIEKAEPTTNGGDVSDDGNNGRREKSEKRKAGKVCRHEHYHYHYHYGMESSSLRLMCSKP